MYCRLISACGMLQDAPGLSYHLSHTHNKSPPSDDDPDSAPAPPSPKIIPPHHEGQSVCCDVVVVTRSPMFSACLIVVVMETCSVGVVILDVVVCRSFFFGYELFPLRKNFISLSRWAWDHGMVVV